MQDYMLALNRQTGYESMFSKKYPVLGHDGKDDELGT